MFLESLYFEKYKTVQPLKLHIIQNSPFVQIYNSDSNDKSWRLL